MSCPHVSFLRRVNRNEMSHKLKCDECRNNTADVWLCMQNCCAFVGCGQGSKNHIRSHHKKTGHAICLCKNDHQVWCFECGCKLDEVQLSFSQDIEECCDHEKQDSMSDDNDTMYTEDDVMMDHDYFDGFEKGMKPRGLTGLTNIGNTCYMNSALQALSNCPSLMQFFLECPGFVKHLPQANVTRHYRNLVTEMWSKKRLKSVVPSEFSQCVQKMNPQFRGFRQQDAQEFLRVLMDLLHEELKEPAHPMTCSKETVLKKTGNPKLSRPKRLLGGTTVVQMPADDLVPNRLKKPRPNTYNLRSFSRQKADVLREALEKEQSANETKNYDPTRVPELLTNSHSCPELCEGSLSYISHTDDMTPSIEPKEPALSMGFDNLASNDDEPDGSSTDDDSTTAKLGFTRAVSDSEINYCEQQESQRKENTTVGKFFSV